MEFRCSVTGCTYRDTKEMPKFPSNPDVAKIWAEVLGMSSYKQNQRVCPLHFVSSDFIHFVKPNGEKGKRLNPKAVPSQNLQSLVSMFYSGAMLRILFKMHL